jgi:hypothetical protein
MKKKLEKYHYYYAILPERNREIKIKKQKEEISQRHGVIAIY